METLYSLPFAVFELPNLKLKKPTWLKQPSAMVVFSFVLLSYFLVTGGIIYDVINEPPSIGSTTDERGNSKPVAFMPYRVNGPDIMKGLASSFMLTLVAFMPYRVNGQYIMEGLASSFMFTLGGLGFIVLDQVNKPMMPRLNRILLLCVGFAAITIAFFMCRVFMRIKLPGYLLDY